MRGLDLPLFNRQSRALDFVRNEVIAFYFTGIVLLAFATFAAWLPNSSAQQVPVTLNTAFHPKITQTGSVHVIAQVDGKLIVGGHFNAVNGTRRYGLARLNADASFDPNFQADVGPTGYVRSIAVQRNGKILIGGRLYFINGTRQNDGIARLNADGSLDTKFAPKLLYSGGDEVDALAVQADGKILLGGYFPGINGVARPNLVRLNADGSLDESFRFPLTENGTVQSLLIQGDGKILVAGAVIHRGGQDLWAVVRLEADGTPDPGFQRCVFGETGYGTNMALQPDGKIVVGGGFIEINGESRRDLARLNADGTVDGSFASPALTLPDGGLTSVESFVVQSDGRVVVATYDDTRRFNVDGTPDPSFASSDIRGYLDFLAVAGDGHLYAAGDFTRLGGVTRDSLARFNADGTLDDGFQPTVGADGSVNAFSRQENGKIVVAGDFHRVNGAVRDGLARLNSDGTLDNGFVPDPILQGEIRAVTVQRDGEVFIGGYLEAMVGSVKRYGLLRLKVDGSLDPNFAVGLSASGGHVNALKTLDDDRVLVGGDFNHLGGAEVHNLARLNADGSLDGGFRSPFGNYDLVSQLVVQPDGKILVASDPPSGEAEHGLVRLNVDGSLDATFQPGLMAGSTVSAVALQVDGKVLFHVSPADGSKVYYDDAILRVGPDGSRDTSFHTTLDSYQPVNTLALQADGKVLVGAPPRSYGGSGEPGVVRLNPDGSTDIGYRPVFRLDDGTNSSVSVVTVQPDGQILVAGNFHSVDGAEQSALALLPALTPVTVSVSDSDFPYVREGVKVKVTFTRTGDVSAPLEVFYKVKGSGRNGLEGKPTGGSIVIRAGKREAKVRFNSVDDIVQQGTRKIAVEVRPSSTGEYTLGTTSRVRIQLLDND